jgi:hypothetical protein
VWERVRYLCVTFREAVVPQTSGIGHRGVGSRAHSGNHRSKLRAVDQGVGESSMRVPTRTAHWPVLRFVITVFDRPWNP